MRIYYTYKDRLTREQMLEISATVTAQQTCASDVTGAGAKVPATGEGLRRTSHLLFHCKRKYHINGKCLEQIESFLISAAFLLQARRRHKIDLFSFSKSGVSLRDNRIRHLQSWFLTAATGCCLNQSSLSK